MNLPGKILVVDDHLALAENIAEILESAGYETTVADSAESALARLAEGGIVALLTDFRLPGKTGAELIEELRRIGSQIPVVVMSAYTDARTIEVSESAGALDVLPKPVDIRRLLGLVSTFGGDDVDVLVVDDNRALADNIAEALKGRGIEPIVGTTAAEALGHRRRPRAAIVDFRLPDRSGVEVAERLSARDPRIRIVFVSAYGDELRGRLRGSLAGSPLLDKPVEVEKLLAWITKALTDAGPRSHR